MSDPTPMDATPDDDDYFSPAKVLDHRAMETATSPEQYRNTLLGANYIEQDSLHSRPGSTFAVIAGSFVVLTVDWEKRFFNLEVLAENAAAANRAQMVRIISAFKRCNGLSLMSQAARGFIASYVKTESRVEAELKEKGWDLLQRLRQTFGTKKPPEDGAQ